MTRLYIIYIFLFFLLFTSCKENFFDSIIDVEVPEHESQLTVTAHLFDGNPDQRIFVNQSRGILDSAEIKPVTNVVADLYEGDNLIANFLFTPYEDRGERGRYLSDSISFVSGASYTLKMQSEEFGNIESTQITPTKVKINAATYEKEGTIDRYGERVDEISIEFDDPQGEKNYYAVFVSGAYLFENNDTSFIIPNWGLYDTPVDPIIEEASGILLFSDATLDGKNYTLRFGTFAEDTRSYPTINGERIEGKLLGLTVSLLSVSQDYYSFWKSMETFEANQDNFFAEPTNVYENIQGGIGIFTINVRDEYVIEF